MPARPVAVLDADVLVPILSCDLLLTAFEHDLFQPVVTPKNLTEVEHTLIDDFPHLDPTALTRRAAQVASALRFHTLADPTITSTLEGVNQKDRHVVAAALMAKADLVVTNDKRLRRETNRLSQSVRAATADGFMVTLDKATPAVTDATLNAMVAKRVQRPNTKPELLDQLTASLPEFAGRAKGRFPLTADLDAARSAEHTVESYAGELSRRLSEGWHGFTGRLVDREPSDPPDVPPEYVMQPFDVKLSYASQSYLTVQLELGHDEVGSTSEPRLALESGIADVIERLGFPRPAPVPVLAVEHQVAQKVHACTTPNRHDGNERAHDLVDLQILVAADPPDLHELATVGRRLFAARRVAAWPPAAQAWPGWDQLYTDAAEGLDVLPLTEAVAWLNDLVVAAEHAAGDD